MPSTPNRVQPGVPTGGQFAATERAVAAVTLNDTTANDPVPDASPGSVELEAMLPDAYSTGNGRHIEALSIRLLGLRLRESHPNVTTIVLEDSDQELGRMRLRDVLLADGRSLASVDEDAITEVDDNLGYLATNLDHGSDWTAIAKPDGYGNHLVKVTDAAQFPIPDSLTARQEAKQLAQQIKTADVAEDAERRRLAAAAERTGNYTAYDAFVTDDDRIRRLEERVSILAALIERM